MGANLLHYHQRSARSRHDPHNAPKVHREPEPRATPWVRGRRVDRRPEGAARTSVSSAPLGLGFSRRRHPGRCPGLWIGLLLRSDGARVRSMIRRRRVKFMPRRKLSTPRGKLPMARGKLPMARGKLPMPRGKLPMPRGKLPMPRGKLPMPRGKLPTPRGKLPTPRGKLPMSRGKLPMSRGKLPSRRGKRPSPRDTAVFPGRMALLDEIPDFTGPAPGQYVYRPAPRSCAPPSAGGASFSSLPETANARGVCMMKT